jgi:alkylation response protein AidB-like acyl-CoA dehydrogenase
VSVPPALLASEFSVWLQADALSLDRNPAQAAEVLPHLAAGGVLGAGVAEELGGNGGDVTDGVEAVAAVSECSLAVGFVMWGHRTYIEFLLQSPNAALREKLLPDLLAGRVAGAAGLSNAIKFLSGLEELQVAARTESDEFVLNGKLPWATNLRPQGFHVAAAVAHEGGRGAFVASLAHDDRVRIDAGRIIHPDANASLPEVRPAFLGPQCGMSTGLARRALNEARCSLGVGRETLAEPVDDLAAALADR